MARPREFDEHVVLDRARDAFWANGIAATSVTDLTEATGLSTGSLYKAFHSKSELCHRTLDAYLTAALGEIDALLDAGTDPVAGLEAWLAMAAERAADTGPTRGCYAVACAVELAGSDPVVRTRLREHGRALRRRIARAIADAVADGQLDCDPDAGAQLLCACVDGLQVQARSHVDGDTARTTLRLALEALR